MAFVGQNFNSWSQTQNQLSALLNLDPEKYKARPYFGIGHALFDLLEGSKTFWPTKKVIAHSLEGSPFVHEVLQQLARQGYQLHPLTREALVHPEEWISTLNADTLAVVLTRDHSLTGEILLEDSVLTKLNEKRIPCIEIQYAWAWGRAGSPLPFGSQIRVLDGQRALSIMGHRFKASPSSANFMNWSDISWAEDFEKAKSFALEDGNFILDYEEQIRSSPLFSVKGQEFSLRPFWAKDPRNRIFNRTLLLAEGLHGEFFIHRLLSALGEGELLASGLESRLEALNLGRWQGLLPWDWWGPCPLSEDQQMSLVIFSKDFLQKKLPVELLNKVYRECLEKVIQ